MSTRVVAEKTLKILAGLMVLVWLVCVVVSPQPAAAQQVPGPVFDTLADAYKHRVSHGEQELVPQGVNNPDCRVTRGREQAVILVHGTDTTLFTDYSKLGAQIARDGWCVYGADYGAGPTPDKGFGWAPMEESARELDGVVSAAQRSSGASSVVLVGFSQGASVARYWMHSDAGNAAKTRSWIGLASPTRGGNFYGLASLTRMVPWLSDLVGSTGVLSPALKQLVAGSEFNARLNSPAETVPGPRYVTVSTLFDEMMPERHNTAIHGENVRNIVLQDVCPANQGGHMFMTYNPTVIDVVLSELDPGAGRTVQCVPIPLGHSMLEVTLFDAPRKLFGAAHRPEATKISSM